MPAPALRNLDRSQALGVMLRYRWPRLAENADEFGPHAFRLANHLPGLASGLRLNFRRQATESVVSRQVS